MLENEILGADAELSDEIGNGLASLGKTGYRAHAHFDDARNLSIDFTFGESQQVLKFKHDEWARKGTVAKRILEKLNI